jgi:hypothetical protein
MNFFLKILNECKSRALLRVTGSSGILYAFKWDAKLRAYAYQPKGQNEVDDLFKTMRRSTAYVFVPVSIVSPATNLAPSPATVTESTASTQTAELKPPLPAALVEMAMFRGVIVTEDDSEETVKRLIDAYDKGAVQALNSLPAATKKPRKA